MATYPNIGVEADVACWTSGIAAGAGNHLPVGHYGGAVYRSAMRFPIPTGWASWKSIDKATLVFFISDHNHVAPSGGTHYVSRQNTSSLWTKAAGSTSCESGFSGSNNTQNSDIPSTSTDRASFLCGVTANAQKSVDVTAAVRYYKTSGASKIVFVFEASASSEYTEIWSDEKSGYDAYLSIQYSVNSAPNAPALVAPAAGATIVPPPAPTLQWTHSDPNGDPQAGADVFVYAMPANTPVSGWDPNIIVGAGQSVAFNEALTMPGTYEWQVRTKDASLTGALSARRSFTVAGAVAPTGVAASLVFANGAPRLKVDWDLVGRTQKSFRVTGSGGLDSGPITSDQTEWTADSFAVANGTAITGITVEATDTADQTAASAPISFTPRYGLTTHAKFMSSPAPASWGGTTIDALLPAGVTVEYNAAAGVAGTPPTTPSVGWSLDLTTVPVNNWLFWRAWLLPVGGVSPTLNSVTVAVDNVVAQLDKWVTMAGAAIGPPWSVGKQAVYGTRSLRYDSAGAGEQTVRCDTLIHLTKGQTYILSGLMKSDRDSGCYIALVDALGTVLTRAIDGARVESPTLHATTDWYDPEVLDVNRYATPVYTAPNDMDVYVVCRASGAATAVAWFDGIKLEVSTVANPWTPAQIGAVVMDAGGVQVDQTKGGIFRIISSGPVVESNADGLKGAAPYVGPSPPTQPWDGQLWWDSDDTTIDDALADPLAGFQWGTFNLTWSASAVSDIPTTVFPKPYASPPLVFLTTHDHASVANNSLGARSVTATQFQAQGREVRETASTYVIPVFWLAIGTLA